MKMSFTKGCISTSIVIILLLSNTYINAQGLQIGERIPNIEIKRLINYKTDSEFLGNLIGNKSLLIDFWFSACSSCFESFPKIDSIQKEFKDDLNVLLVSYETKETTLNVFKNRKRVSHIKLPSAVSDTLLALLFPHHSAPHEIWVDKNGTIKAITDHRSITRKNIRDLIAGKPLNLPVKKDNMEYSGELPLIKTLDLTKTISYNYFSSWHPGIPSTIGMYIDPESGYLRATVRNCGIRDLYILAYGLFGNDFNPNRFIMDESVNKRFEQSNDSMNTFCFENWWRDTTKESALQEMQYYLDRTLKLKTNSEKRNIPCIILKKTGTSEKYKYGSDLEKPDIYVSNDTLHLKGVNLRYPIEHVLNYGRFAWSPYQFIDETGYEGKMNIALPAKFHDIAQVNNYLKNFDLEITIEDRWLDVIVIKEGNQ